ncbi:MAG: helix-turn-helix transcriptional regulator [Halobacteriovoraceae bacterium]|nr:helix-turn-helix transcriptional regulator [Halobacteriovoraceae bacterium]
MKSTKIKAATFSNKKKEIQITYTSGKEVVIHFGSIGITKNIQSVWPDKETNYKSLGIEYADGEVDYMPYDQPLAIVKDPEFLLQNHIENVISHINEELKRKKVSKKYLARQLGTSDNQIQRLLNPNILNKNLTQLYKLAALLELQFEMNLVAA